MRGSNGKQDGMATFAVTTVLILVIALIIIGFSQVVRRNQRETLDRQLSTQALFAAESGVNSIVSSLRDQLASGQVPPPKNDCAPDSNYANPALNITSTTDAEVKITCFLIATNINNLYYMGINENTPKVVPLVSADNTNIAELVVEWNPTGGGTSATATCPTAFSGNTLSTRAAWSCGHAVLRGDLATQPTGSPSTAVSMFFRPVRVTTALSAANAPVMNYSSQGGLVRGDCTDVGPSSKCMVKITGLNAPTYYMSLRSIYNDSDVRISGTDVNGNSVRFTGQAMVDVTAKAEDVIKRIQVRVPLVPRETSDLPAYAIESTDSICKRYSVAPPSHYNGSPSPGVTCN